MEELFCQIISNEEEIFHETPNPNFKTTLNILNEILNEKCLNEQHFQALRAIVKSKDGLMSSKYRKTIYTLIIKFIKDQHINLQNHTNVDSSANYDAIELDCNRSIVNKILTNDDKDKLVIYLIEFTKKFFEQNKSFKYYQGFNDFAFYILLLENKSNELLNDLSDIFFYPYLLNEISFDIVLAILTDLIALIDNGINKHLLRITNAQPYYALSWIITWFAHNNKNIQVQYRLMDYLILSPPPTIFYLSAAVILN
jgi:hypothetical protein